jgi:hypothetical protein
MSGSAADADRPVPRLEIVRPLAALTRLLLPPEIGKPPPDILAGLQARAETARRLTREHLLRASEAGSFEAAIEALGWELSQGYERQFEMQREHDAELVRRLAAVECRRGCSFCCHMNVGVTPLEAARIALALRRETYAERREAVLEADRHLDRRGAEARLALRMLCPLLVDGACSIYELRPLACRALLSLNARACELELQSQESAGATRVPTLVTPRLIAAGIISGEVAAMEDLGLASHLVELTAGVAVLLREPRTLDRWLDGEDTFPQL